MTKAFDRNQETRRLFTSYFIGFGLSLVITTAAFFLAMLQAHSGGGAFPRTPLIVGLFVLAVTQLVVQLMFFFHLGRETKPRLNTVSFLFMLMVVGIIGGGSLWIMNNLNYNMMPKDVENYVKYDENIQTDEMQMEHH